MSRQQIYAWVALASAFGIAGYYILAVVGLPGGAEAVSDQLGGIFIRVILIAAAAEILLDIAQSVNKFRVDKDERDRMIEGKGFRNAYYVLVVVVFSAIGHLVITGLLGEYLEEGFIVSLPLVVLHILVLGVFGASMVNSVTRLYLYHRGA